MRGRFFFIALLVALIPSAPLAAAETITGESQVHGGIYSSGVWESSQDLNALASWSKKRVTFAGSFHNIYESEGSNWDGNTDWILEQAWQGKATPVANVNLNASAAAIAGGTYDAAIRQWATRVQAWLNRPPSYQGEPARNLLVAPLQEMNGNWTPYGMDPANFKKAFAKFRDTFRDLGMTENQVRWVFAPNGWSTPGYSIVDYYPGPSVVDVIGISAYNFGDTINNAHWQTVPQVFNAALAELRGFAPQKPYLFLQTASSKYYGDRNAWLRDMFSYAASDPNVVGLVYFNIDTTAYGETDFRVWYGSSGEAGFRDGMQYGSTVYQWPLTNWFQSGPLPFSIGPAAVVCPPGRRCDSVALVDGGAKFFVYGQVGVGASVSSFFYGAPGDVPLMGDWDCDGVKTPAMYRPSNGFMYLRNSNTQGVGEVSYFYGDPSDVPLAGDFNGNGCDTLAIYRPAEGKVYVKNSLGTGIADYSFFFGNPGDKPFVGDFDGDGFDTVGLHRESSGFVYFRNSNTQGVADFSFFYGDPGDKILAGDWDGDGDDTVAVYRTSNGMLYLKNANSQGVADFSMYAGTYVAALRTRLP
jgi:hypothetical protein